MTNTSSHGRMAPAVTLMEVSPRDGLQNESVRLSTEDKLTLIHRALDAGCKRIEVTSFAHPKVVPQMADAEAVCQGLPQRGDVIYTGLVLNQRGYERLLATGRLDEAGLVERRLGSAAQLVQQCPARRGGDDHLVGAGLAVQPAVLARLVQVERVVCVLDG